MEGLPNITQVGDRLELVSNVPGGGIDELPSAAHGVWWVNSLGTSGQFPTYPMLGNNNVIRHCFSDEKNKKGGSYDPDLCHSFGWLQCMDGLLLRQHGSAP